MRQVIKSKTTNPIINTDNQFILKCSCGGCGLLEFTKYNDGDVSIMYYSTSNLKKRDKYAWDILIDSQQAQELLNNLNELLNKQ